MPDRKDISEHANDFPAPAAQLAPGIVLNARYEIVRPLHQGETGAVYLAVDGMLERHVAIKELAVDPEQRERTIRRFKKYASRLSRLDHPSIPAVYDFFYAEQFGRFYVVMQHVEGTNLVALIHDTPGGRLDEKRVAELAHQVASVLDYLHTLPIPIVYRNLNPGSLVVTEGWNVMLMHWFGRWVNEEYPWKVFSQTTGYAAGELFRGHSGPRSDVFSLGVIMAYLLTGVEPRKTARSFLPIDPELLQPPLISHQMEWLLRRTLQYRPEDRVSAGELRIALADLRRDQSTQIEAPPPTAVAHVAADEPQPYLDENVQFTVYRPNKIKPLKWYPLLAYAHLTEPRDADDGDDLIARVQEEAERIMRDQKVDDFRQASEDSLVAIPRKGEISFVPFISGVDFNPSRASFFWEEIVHRVDFRMRASATLDGKTARGRMSIFLGAILLAEINLSVQVTSSSHVVQTQREQPVRPYRHIFPSYSHKDREIVAQIEHYAQTTGDRYMRDVFELRSGQNWKKWMAETIEGADIFQLFWSTNSMRSENVRLEWEHALRLKREHFIRPTYWETPLPTSPSENLPPPELRDLHFQHVRPPAYSDLDEVAPGSLAADDLFISYPHAEPENRFEIPSRDAVERLEPAEKDRRREAELNKWLEEKTRQEDVLSRKQQEARSRAEEEARRRAEQRALKQNEPVRRNRKRRDEEEARVSSQYDAWEERVSRTTQSGPPRRHAAMPLWILPTVVVLGLLLLLLVGFLIWRN